MSLAIKEFNLNSIIHKDTNKKDIPLIGRRDTGRSFLVRDLVYYDKNNTNKNIDNNKVEISNK